MNSSNRLESATKPDGFVDFYTLLNLAPHASEDDLREAINALYKEAHTNRDHRIAAQKREAHGLLEILPHARTVLLTPTRRKRYNAYRGAVEMGSPRLPYSEFFQSLTMERDEMRKRAEVLAVRDLGSLRLQAQANDSGVAREHAMSMNFNGSRANGAARFVDEPKPESQIPIARPEPASSTKRAALPSIIGGAVVLAGLLVSLPVLTGVSVVVAAILALVSAFVTAHVFSLANDSVAI